MTTYEKLEEIKLILFPGVETLEVIDGEGIYLLSGDKNIGISWEELEEPKEYWQKVKEKWNIKESWK